MLSTLLQAVLASALLLGGTLPRVPPLDMPAAEQRAMLRAQAPRPEDVGFTRRPEHVAPVLTASSALVVDLESGAELYALRPSRRMAIASITKLMTALVVLEREPNLDATAVVPGDAHSIIGTRSWLQPGHRYSVRDLLRAVLISSAADATLTLQDAVGGTRGGFVDLMNERAISIGLTATRFTNAVGLDADENYGTAQDVVTLLRAVWEHPFARETLPHRTFEVRSREGRVTQLTSTNALLGTRGYVVTGGKTGTTDEAGQAFVAVGSVEGGRPVLVVVLGSHDRFRDTKTLLAWVERAWER